MATVVVFDVDKVLELFNSGVSGGVIDASGDLILQRPDGTSVNLGNVKSHSQLTDLDADDHPQYAFADGSRGDFATPAQGAKADAARKNVGATVDFDAGSGTVVETVSITNDGTDTNTWPNRWIYRFRDSVVGAWRTVTSLNEYGELRVAPAKSNTTGARFFVKELAAHPARDMNVPVVELMDDRTTRTSLRAWLGDGSATRNGIKTAEVIRLIGAAAVPAGTPTGTLIVRTAS